jgi:hypothetical protein
MQSISLRRVTRRVAMLAGLVGALALSTSVGHATTWHQITNADGTIYAPAAGLYTVATWCYTSSGAYTATVCHWYVRKLYGDQSAVVVVIHQPNGVDPACYSGYTAQISSGYSRSQCILYASDTAYGN